MILYPFSSLLQRDFTASSTNLHGIRVECQIPIAIISRTVSFGKGDLQGSKYQLNLEKVSDKKLIPKL